MRTIHLMGLGPGWSLAPPCGPGVKIWGINNVLNWRPVDYVMEIHNWRLKMTRLKGGGVHQRAMNKAVEMGIPYIVRERWDFAPGLKQVVYPWEAIFDKFGHDFLGCSMDCMMALAIYCGYNDINIYGLGINAASQYDYQLKSQNYWFGYCDGAGIKVTVHNVGGYRHTDIMRNDNGLIYGLNKPQTRVNHGLDPTLPECDCVKMHEAAHCFDLNFTTGR